MRIHRLIVLPLGIILSACNTSVAAPQTNCTSTAQGASVLPSTATLSAGDTLRLDAALPGMCPGPMPRWEWKSANTAVASVDTTGLVTAVAAGTTAISAAPTFDPTIGGAATVRVLP